MDFVKVNEQVWDKNAEFMKSKGQNSLEVMMNEVIYENKEALEELAK